MTDNAHLTIRTARVGEAAAILALTLDAYEQYGASLPPGFWPRYRHNLTATLLECNGAEQFVAQDAGELIGAVLLYPPGVPTGRPGSRDAAWPEIRLLAVSPHARGRGVARQLMAECVRRAQAWHAPGLALCTMDVMEVAQQMYQRMGFTRAPELDFRPDDKVQVIGYRLRFLCPVSEQTS